VNISVSRVFVNIMVSRVIKPIRMLRVFVNIRVCALDDCYKSVPESSVFYERNSEWEHVGQ
jgi:hypothetical protein